MSWATLRPRPPSSFSITSATWAANSRVGTSTSACTRLRRGSRRSTSGKPKAMVLPEPVRDWPMTSRPAIKGGMARV